MSFNYEQSTWGAGDASLSWYSPTRNRLRHALKSIKDLPSGSNVLEIGCGAGQFIRTIKKLRPELNCFGYDISQNAITKAKQYNDGVQYKFSESSKPPYDDRKFQAVFIFDVLEHVEDPNELIKEVNRILDNDGIFSSFVPCEGDVLSFWNLLRGSSLTYDLTKKYAGHIQKFSRYSISKIIKNNNFKIISKKYSSHLCGQVLDLMVFASMEEKNKKNKQGQINNESFFDELNKNKSKAFFVMKKLINFLVNLEGFLLSWLPSPNIHITAIKKI
jgi:ubiquinone/menaquinone biosynthesis C-methylase UbiE